MPVKDARRGKTRLSAVLSPGHRAELVRAMALDTLLAALACDRVAQVLVVTVDPSVAAEVTGLEGATVVPEPPHAGQRTGFDTGAGGPAGAQRRSSCGCRNLM
ncbi:hypothetical protein [Cellulomonas sp. SG140]|uniref:hypothetical protein n=1 Tax=Cellulomonas sp. SG140 TaxID=2976536 RepID=UPI0021E7B9C8|nr:hypothetical protein [Cellulomonas sp. SG140]